MSGRQASADQVTISPWSAALLGAAVGAIGVWALDRLDWWMWRHESDEARERTTAVRPGGEPPAEVLVRKAAKAAGAELSPQVHRRASDAVHYSIGIAPAIAYALLRNRLPVRGVPRGALYGLGVFVLQDEGLNTVAGLGAEPQAYPWQAHARGLLAHTLYGITTEAALNAGERVLHRARRREPELAA